MAATDRSIPEVDGVPFVIDSLTTLAAVVTARPDLAPVLDGLGLDFCCHGQRGLGQASSEAGRDVESTLAVLRAAMAVPALPADWSLLDPVSLVAHIVSTHHDFLRSEAPRVAVGDLLDQLRSLSDQFLVPADGCRTYAAFYSGLDRIDADTRLHVHKENNVFFPAVLAGAAGTGVATGGR